MCTPSSSSYAATCGGPLGQMTETCQPARVSARASSQTRRSNGTDRFSTRIRALPGEADILSVFYIARLHEANEVDERLPVPHPGRNTPVRRMTIRDHDRLGAQHHVLGLVAHQAIEVRNLALQVEPVRPHELRHVDVGIVEEYFVALAHEGTHHAHDRALAQIVGSRLEGQTEDADLLLSGLLDR